MKTIVITKEESFADEAQLLNQLFAADLECLHLRKPRAGPDDLRTLLKVVEERYHQRIVLHDCFELVNEFCLKGIHLNSRHKKPLGNLHGLTLSKSCHSLGDLHDISLFDYVFLSPVFDSISKAGYRKQFPDKDLQHAKESNLINNKVIALGGITKETAPVVKSFGFGGVALLGTVWLDQKNAVRNFLRIKNAF